MPSPVNSRNTSTESINALVVPFVQFVIRITINAKTKIGKKAKTYDRIIFNILNEVPLIKKDAVTDRIITISKFAIIKLAAARTFPVKTLNLEAGLVRVSFMVCSTNSPPNISIHINAVNRGIKV